MLARKSPTSFTRLLGRVTVAAIALSFSYSIWAQKPAHTENIDQAPKKGDMLVFFTATVGDNVLKQVSMPGADGEATIRQTVDNEEWLVDFVVQPKPADRFVGTFKVTRNGELQGHPTLEWQRDGSASMSISNDAGETQFAMDVRATVLDKDMPVIDSNIREASTAPREAHTLNIAEAAKNVAVIRQVDGSYRLDNLPKGLSPEEYRALMEQVMPILHDTMQKNGDAPAETEASEAKPAAAVSPVSIDFHPAWQIDFMAQANPPDQC